MKEGKRETKHILELLLKRVYRGALFVRHLLVDLSGVEFGCSRSTDKIGFLTSFSPNEKTGTRSALESDAKGVSKLPPLTADKHTHPCCIASLINPSLYKTRQRSLRYT